MKKLLLFIVLMWCADLVAQPLNYSWYKTRTRQYSIMVDSMFYVPRYNGTPSGVRVNENSAIDGAVAVDTSNHRMYMYSGGAWVRLANYLDIAASTPTWQQTLTAGSTLTGDNTIAGGGFDFTFNNHRYFTIDADTGAVIQAISGTNQSYALFEHSSSGLFQATMLTNKSGIGNQLYMGQIGSNNVFLELSNTPSSGHTQSIEMDSAGMRLTPDGGELFIDSLDYGAGDKEARWNSSTGKITYYDISGGSGGDSLPPVLSIVVFGDSYGTGYPSYIPWDTLLANDYGATLDNQSVSARGVWEQVKRANQDAVLPNNNKSVVIPAAGLNDIRRNGGASKTINKIRNSFGSAIVNAFKKSTVNGANSSLMRNGFIYSYTAQDLGGKYGSTTFPAVPNSTHANLSDAIGDSLSYTFTGNNIAIQFMGNSGATETYTTQAQILIDDVPVDTMNLNNQWDNVSDGSNDNRRGPVFWWYAGLTLGSHKATVKNLDGDYLPVDFFAVLNQPENCQPVICLNIPYLNATGYAVSPNLGSISNTDSANNAINAIVTEFAKYGYPVTFGSTNAFFDIATAGDADSIHPNQEGHYQIRNAAKAALVSAFRPAYSSASLSTSGGGTVTSVLGTADLVTSTGGTDPVISVGKNITLQIDTVTLYTFNAGNRIARDTAIFTDSTLYGAFFNDYTDTLVVTKVIGVMAGGISDTLGVQAFFNDTLNVIGTEIIDTLPLNSTTIGNYTDVLIDPKIPPGNWVWCKSPSVQVGRRPQFLSVSLIGYKSRTIAPTPSDYPLDEYPGAAAAYSMRLLKSDYAGSAIRVRRKSDNAEQDIGFTGTPGDLDTASLKTFVGTGGTDSAWIVKWYDQSGNANDAVQSTQANQPQIMVGGAILRLNGMPSFEIIGQSQYVTLTSAVTTTRSGFMVYNSAATNSNNPSILGDASANDFHGIASNSLMYNTSFCSANITGGTHYINNVSYSAASVPKATPQQIYSFFTSGNVTVGNISNDRVSFSRSWLGRFQEVILYTTDKSSIRAGMELNINGYYGAY